MKTRRNLGLTPPFRARQWPDDRLVGAVVKPPRRIELPDAVLRPFAVADADSLAHAVEVSLTELKPWMPWADATAADPKFQRERLAGVVAQFARGEEYQYGLFDSAESEVLGSFGLMTRRGRGTLEIGYWLRSDATGRGHGTRAAGALTNVGLGMRGVKKILIYTDEANTRSAAIPRRLAFDLLRVEDAPATAPSETGRQQVWVRMQPVS